MGHTNRSYVRPTDNHVETCTQVTPIVQRACQTGHTRDNTTTTPRRSLFKYCCSMYCGSTYQVRIIQTVQKHLRRNLVYRLCRSVKMISVICTAVISSVPRVNPYHLLHLGLSTPHFTDRRGGLHTSPRPHTIITFTFQLNSNYTNISTEGFALSGILDKP